MKNLVLTIVMSVLGFTSFSATSNNPAKKMETIVLVHGAWLDASGWDAVVPLLKAKGHEVIAVNLVGHGNDTTSFAAISLQTYVDQVKAAIGTRTNVILVGHSFGGIVISQVAEEIPGQIKELIYLAAGLPHDGDDLLSLSKGDAASHIGKYLTVDQPHGAAIISKEGAVDVFAADAPQQIKDYITANIKPEPLGPLATPVHLTDKNFGSIRKVYIHTLNDHAISYPAQQAMVNANKVAKVYSLPSSHTPFFSMPDKLAAIILAESK
jgi:pimeloyl-ACP methyl ester carboxylesterase